MFIFREFKRLALGVLDQCFQTNEELTQQLLTYHLENWGGQTCLSLAVSIEYEEFLAHASCQALLTDIWTGAMRNAHRSSIKVREWDAVLTTLITAYSLRSSCCIEFISLGEFLEIRRERRGRGSEDKEPTSNAYNSEWRDQIFRAKYGPADSYFPLVHFFSHEYHSEYYRARINSVVPKSPYCMNLTKRWQKKKDSG